MPGESLQETQPANRRALRFLDSGQDTTEYVLIILLFALAVTAGMLVWSRSVEGSYSGTADCVASAVRAEERPPGTPLAQGGDQYEDRNAGQEGRPDKRCPAGR